MTHILIDYINSLLVVLLTALAYRCLINRIRNIVREEIERNKRK